MSSQLDKEGKAYDMPEDTPVWLRDLFKKDNKLVDELLKAQKNNDLVETSKVQRELTKLRREIKDRQSVEKQKPSPNGGWLKALKKLLTTKIRFAGTNMTVKTALLDRAAENAFQNGDVHLANALYNEAEKIAATLSPAKLRDQLVGILKNLGFKIDSKESGVGELKVWLAGDWDGKKIQRALKSKGFPTDFEKFSHGENLDADTFRLSQAKEGNEGVDGAFLAVYKKSPAGSAARSGIDPTDLY